MRVGLSVVLWVMLAVPSVHAQNAAARSRAIYEQAQQTYDRGEIEKALALFLKAYEVTPLPGFLFNIAQCHRQLRNYERSSFYFKRYLALARNTANATVVRDLIVEVDGKQAEAEEARRSEAAAVRAQEVELARIAATKSEALQQQETRQLELTRSLQEPPSTAQSSGSVLTQWWLWAGVGVIVAGATASAVYVGTAPSARPTTLGTESVR